MNNEQQQIIDEVYENYINSLFYDFSGEVKGYLLHEHLSKEEFVNKYKTDNEFSEKWGLKIEERELTTVRERKKYDNYFDDLIGEYIEHHETLDKRGVPRKIITVTYKDKTIESYEY